MFTDAVALRNYIVNLPVGLPSSTATEDGAAVNTIDINGLPDGIVTGSNLIQFPSGVGPEIKSSVALSLLAAQRVASNDPVVASPAQWLERHNTVLQNLNWRVEGGGTTRRSSRPSTLQCTRRSSRSSPQRSAAPQRRA